MRISVPGYAFVKSKELVRECISRIRLEIERTGELSGILPCPVCKKVLKWTAKSTAPGAFSISGKCRQEHCLSWIE